MSKNFKAGLLLLTRTTIKNILGIDVVHTASNVVVIRKGILIGGGYREYVSAIYEIHGVSNGKPYSIRLYTTYGTGYGLTGFQLDRDGDGITVRWGANLTLSENEMVVYDKEDRFPKLTDELITREDICDAAKAQMVKIYDVDNIEYCEPGNAAPVITMLGDAMVTLTETTPWVDPGATATDDIDGDITSHIITGGDAVDTSVVGEYVITYTVADQFGATSMAVRHVHVVPNVAPVVTLVGDSPINIIEGHPYVEPGVIAQDSEDGDITANVVVSGDVVDTNTPGDYTITYTVTDSHGGTTTLSRTVVVIANDAPVITLVGDSPMELIQGTAYVEPGYNATDTEDGNIASTVTVTGTVDHTLVGVYTLVYTVTDSGGKTASVNRVVNVIANTAPVITLLGDATMEVLNGNMYVDPGFTAYDANQGDLTASVVVGGDTVDTTTDGTYVISYSVEDANGGSDTVTRTVTVRTNIAPVITLNGDAEITMTVGESYVEPGATAVDSWDGDVTAGISITGNVDTSVAGNYTITYTVVDTDGMSTSMTRLVKVLVNELPSIQLLGASAVEVYRGEAFYEPGYTATDAEDGDITNAVVVTPQPLPTDLLGDVMRTYSVTDSNAGTATLTRLVHVIEDEAPVITLLGDNPAMIYQGTAYVEAGATALDYRDGDVTADIVIGGDVVDPNTPAVYQVSYTVTDSKGHVSVKTRAVTVQLNEAPVITLNGPATIEVIENQIYTELGASATDAEDGDVSASIVITGVVNTTVLGDYIITYKATDSHGVEGMATRTVTVITDQPPTITLAGDNPLRVVGGTPYVEPGYTAQDDVDGDLSASVVIGGDTVNENLSGTYNITYSVTAANSASTIVTREVNVRFAPTITLTAGDMSIATGTSFIDPGYSAFDAEQGDITSSVVVSGDTVVPGTPGTYDITYSVTDNDGMISTATRRVIVSDRPVITLIGGTPAIVKTGDVYNDLGASAFDSEDGNLTASMVTNSNVDTATSGTYTVTYNVTDSHGIVADTVTRTVVVSDQPVVTLLGDASMVLDVNTNYVEPGYTAYDFEDGDITANVVVNSNVDTSTPGDYTITYTVTDSNGIIANTVSRAIKISTRPSIQLLGANPIPAAFGSVWVEPGYTAQDSEDGDITANVVVSGDTVDTSSVGTYAINYSVTDSSGLTGVASRLVNVSHPPSITLSGPTTIALATGDAFVDPGYTASDIEDGDLTASIVVGGDTVDPNTPGSYIITYTVTDSVGLETVTQRTVIVQDTPTVSLVGSSMVVVEKNTPYTEQGATAVDANGNDITASIDIAGSVDTSATGNYTLIYQATDALGLSGTITRTITVSTAPVITLLGDASLSVLLNSVYTDAGATASDIEDGDLTASIVTSSNVDMTTVGTYTVTYTVQDSNFLSDTKTRTVIVAEAPVITVIGSTPLTVEQNSTFTDPGATATDATDGVLTGSIVVSGDTVDTSTLGPYTVVYTVTNSQGLSATTSRVVNVKAKPVITLLGDASVNVPLNGTFTDPGATASDLEDGDLTASIVVSANGDTSTLGSYLVTYNVTDNDGFSADEVTRTVVVSSVPSITLLGLTALPVEKGTTYTDPGYTATDAEDGDITANVVVSGDTVDVNTVGAYTINYDVVDSNGYAAPTVSRTVNVSSKPFIALSDNSEAHLAIGDVYVEPGDATAYDPEDGDLTGSIVIVNNVVTSAVGTYTITYNVVDSVGVAADERLRTIFVHERPVITLLGDSLTNVNAGEIYTDAGATAVDETGVDITSDILVTGIPADTNTGGTYTITYNVKDANNIDASQVTRTLVINSLPIIDLAGPNPVVVQLGNPFTDPGYAAHDPEDGDVSANIIVSGDTVDTSIAGSYNIVYSVTDSDGGTATETRVVNVIPKPVITLLGDASVSLSLGDVYTDAGATAVDGNGIDITSDIVTFSNVDTATAGSYTVSYNVTDSNGFVATEVIREVQVSVSPPVITVLGDNPMSIDDVTVYNEPGATAVDSNGVDISADIAISSDIIPFVAGSYTVNYQVYDANNVSGTASRAVTVYGIPHVTITGDNPMAVALNDAYVEQGATATDAEDGDISANITIGGDMVDTSVAGSYNVTYSSTDADGHSVTETRVVNVNALPVLTLLGNEPYYVQTGTVWTDPGYTAIDPEDGDISASVNVTGGPNMGVAGTYSMDYSVTDSAGATASATRTVIVTSPPTIYLTEDYAQQESPVWVVRDSAATYGQYATSQAGNDITNLITITGAADLTNNGTYAEQLNVIDPDTDLSWQETRVVNVVNSVDTTIVPIGDNPLVLAIGDAYVEQGATVTDILYGDVSGDEDISGTVDTAVAGDYTITYTYQGPYDAAPVVVTRTVTVQ